MLEPEKVQGHLQVAQDQGQLWLLGVPCTWCPDIRADSYVPLMGLGLIHAVEWVGQGGVEGGGGRHLFVVIANLSSGAETRLCALPGVQWDSD